MFNDKKITSKFWKLKVSTARKDDGGITQYYCGSMRNVSFLFFSILLTSDIILVLIESSLFL